MAMTIEQTMVELENFWNSNLRFWERELKVSSDESKQPMIESLTEFCRLQLEFSPNHPYSKEENRLDPDAVKEFIKFRKMDIWGKDWENHRVGGKWD